MSLDLSHNNLTELDSLLEALAKLPSLRALWLEVGTTKTVVACYGVFSLLLLRSLWPLRS